MKTKIVAMAAALIVVAGAGIAGISMRAFASGGGTSVKAEVRLTSPTNPNTNEPNDALASGKAKSEQRTSPTRIRFAVEVEDVQSEPGDYAINVNGAQVATVHVDSLGFGELELSSQDCGCTPPTVVVGDLVEVIDPATSTVILSGTMVAK